MTEKPLKILVADDDTSVGDTFSHIITRLGHACDVVRDGKECLRKLALQNYDILFLDLIMPRLDGEAVLQALRGHQPNLDIVVISSEDDEEVINDLLRRNATAYIVKPVSLEAVEGVIRKIELKKLGDRQSHQ